MISVMASRRGPTREVLTEKMVDGAPFDFPKDRQKTMPTANRSEESKTR